MVIIMLQYYIIKNKIYIFSKIKGNGGYVRYIGPAIDFLVTASMYK